MLLIRRYGTGFLCVTNGEKVLFMKCARWAAVRGEERPSGERARVGKWIPETETETGLSAPKGIE